MLITITRTIPLYRTPEDHGVFLQWEITNPPINSDISFAIERAGSPTGPFEHVISNIRTFYFTDTLRAIPAPGPGETRENLNYLSLIRTVYYKVTATSSSESVSTITDVRGTLPRKLMLLRRKMLRDLSIGFKFNSVPIAVLKRRHWGIRCKVCFDLLTKKVTNSKCTSCFGTGFETGYFSPVRIPGRLLAPNSETSITPQGKADITSVRLICAEYPELEVDDIIVEIEQNRRYIITNQSETTLRREMVHQSLVMSELARDSIEYGIPANFDTSPIVY